MWTIFYAILCCRSGFEKCTQLIVKFIYIRKLTVPGQQTITIEQKQNQKEMKTKQKQNKTISSKAEEDLLHGIR